MIHLHHAVYSAYPNAGVINGSDVDSLVVLNKNQQPMTIDPVIVTTKLTELQAQETAQVEAQSNAKQAALNKLMALGLTEEEALALGK